MELTPLQETNLALIEIEKILQANGSTLKKFDKLPYPIRISLFNGSDNRLIHDELSYKISNLRSEHQQLFSKLTEEQKHVYQTILNSVQKKESGMFFVYGYGGTGKTFVWKTISCALRSMGKIVLNVASSGIASLLLTGGRTSHSRFAIPINANEDSVCHITPDSDLADLIRKTSLVIWDEAPMIHKHSFEALDITFRDILRSEDINSLEKPFGGKVMVFGGDFRQILPVVPNGTRSDIVNASIKQSYLWDYCKILKLTINMRLGKTIAYNELQKTKDFADWILRVGNGCAGGHNDEEELIDIPEDILIKENDDPLSVLIQNIYPQLNNHLQDTSYFKDRAILAPTHDIVNLINEHLMETLPGNKKVYLSSDNILQSDLAPNMSPALYSPDFLNSIQLSGLPNHVLTLKAGVPVMLLRNIDQPSGLFNGPRLQVIRLGEHVIVAKIISGSKIGNITFIPRIRLTSSDKKLPFQFQRKQFPLAVCFAMTINKSQGQSLSKVGLYLPRPVFTHGQLYVALSRVTARDRLKVLIKYENGIVTNYTKNVVYKEVLQDLD